LAPTQKALHHSRRVIAALFGAPAARRFDVAYWEGSVERGGAAPATFTLVIARPGALRRMLVRPSELSIVEAFISGDVDVTGSLTDALSIADAINQKVSSLRVLAALVRDVFALPRHDATAEDVDVRSMRAERTVEPAGKPHERRRDRAAIQYHYDVGNDFYQLWLDRSLVYSCAYFHTANDSLDDAQIAKLDLVCRKLRLRPGDRLLDVGCGWGALVIHAASRYGVQAVGITLSEAQRALARERIESVGLSGSCHVEIRDYRDLSGLGPFDKIASVGMVEHVGLERLREYFASIHGALAPGGVFLNHGIVSVEESRPRSWRDGIRRRLWKSDSFIDQYVFPDGKLAPFPAMIAAAEAAGFETRDVESLREHYVLTLRAWVGRLQRREAEAVRLVGRQTYRVWRLYMTASAHGFASGRINVLQTLLSKPRAGNAMLPLTREYLCGT
jgi:cyclopropane-fatty-acyl-phospholipid synthase